jgi:hypothetical protein
MKLNDAQRAEHSEVPLETCIIILPGNQDDYWSASNLIEQVQTKAMPIFNILHPVADSLFLLLLKITALYRLTP